MVSTPAGFTTRWLTEADLPAVQALMDGCETADTGTPCVHEMDIAVASRSRDFEFGVNAWVVDAGDGSLAAAGWVWTPGEAPNVTCDHYVRPDCRPLGLDALLLDLIEARAGEFASVRRESGGVRLYAWVEDKLEERCALVRAWGYDEVREVFQMRIDLVPAPSPPQWPEGIAVRPFRAAKDGRAAHAATEEAFSEHFLYRPTAYDEWRALVVDRDGFDPGLWLVAWDGEKIAGQVRAQRRDPEVLVDDLSVRKGWRGRGLGHALLQGSFGVLAERGYPFVRLYVDAQNATGALQVYLRAGMREERRFLVFEKALT